MEDFVLYNNLFDIYENALTLKQQNIFKLYYRENFSMQEIADEEKVSKAFVGKVIKDVINKLNQLESTFHQLEIKDKLKKTIDEEDIATIKKDIKKIIDII